MLVNILVPWMPWVIPKHENIHKTTYVTFQLPTCLESGLAISRVFCPQPPKWMVVDEMAVVQEIQCGCGHFAFLHSGNLT